MMYSKMPFKPGEVWTFTNTLGTSIALAIRKIDNYTEVYEFFVIDDGDVNGTAFMKKTGQLAMWYYSSNERLQWQKIS